MAPKPKKLPSGKWNIRLYDGKDENGKRICKSFTAERKKDVEAMVSEYLQESKLQKDKAKNPAAHMTLEEAMQKYLDNWHKEKTTWACYDSISRNQFQDIKHMKLSEITNDLIQKSIDKEKLAPKTKKNAVGFIGAVLRKYHKDFRLEVELPKVPKKKKRLPTEEEVIAAVKGTESEIPVLLALWCTLRLSEIKGLRKSDFIEIDNGKRAILTVNNTQLDVRGKQIFREGIAKNDTSQGRQLTVPEPLWKLIKQLPPDQEEIVTVCHSAVRRRFYAELDKHNVERIHLHDLRHMSASKMLEMNIPDKYAMERTGHSTPIVLKNTYQHTFDNVRVDIESKLTALYEAEYKGI